MNLNRRTFLKNGLAGLGGLTLGGLMSRRASAQTAGAAKKYLFAYFEGGWDLLLGLDPRDPATTNAQDHQIDPRYGALQGPFRTRGVQTRGNLAFGPSVPPEMLAHASDVSIIKGITMDTAAHEVGRRYFITGRFPRGLAAVGSSIPAEIVAQTGENASIPNLSAGLEAYATGLPSYATALSVNSLTDLIVALQPFAEIDPAILAAVQNYQSLDPACVAKQLDRDLASTRLRDSQQRARGWIEQRLAGAFDVFEQNGANPDMAALRQLYRITNNDRGPEVLAFIGAQALKEDICQCVSVTVARGLDTHSNWAQDHAPRQEAGWRALAAMITDLKNTPSKSAAGSVWDETCLVVFSEFGRTPLINTINGRDHFLGNCALVAGPGLKRGVTVGESARVGMLPIATELATGRGVERPTEAQLESGAFQTLTPKHVLSTILKAGGLDYDFLRTQAIGAMLT